MINGWEWYEPPAPLHRVFEHLTEYKFDGDGRPVMEGTGTRQVNVQNPPPLEVTGYVHQVWSTVLGKSLMTIGTGGYKAVTNIYAGGALIAKQGASGATWTTADPVTGTTAQFTMINNESVAEVVEESEPLGQTITAISPPEGGQESYLAYKGNVGEPEWQCEAPPEFYGSFSALPWHCQRDAMRNAGSKTPYENEGLEKPTNIPFKHPERSPTEPPATQDGINRLMKLSLLSTSKRMDDNESGSDGEGDENDEPIRVSTWTFQRPERVSNPIEFNNAEFGYNNSPLLNSLADKKQDIADRTATCVKIVQAHLTKEIVQILKENNKSSQGIALLVAHAAVESTLGTQLDGLRGEKGLFQLKPSTARTLNLEKFTDDELRNDFGLNTRLATAYLQQRIDAQGSLIGGLQEYKEGQGNLKDGVNYNTEVYAQAIVNCSKSTLVKSILRNFGLDWNDI